MRRARVDGRRRRSAGFTLIEAVVALAILAIAAVGLMRAATGDVERVGRLEERAFAGWVAENQLAELRLVHARPDNGTRMVTMGGRSWSVATATAGTNDPDLMDVTVAVSAAPDAPPVVSLRGFVDAGLYTP